MARPVISADWLAAAPELRQRHEAVAVEILALRPGTPIDACGPLRPDWEDLGVFAVHGLRVYCRPEGDARVGFGLLVPDASAAALVLRLLDGPPPPGRDWQIWASWRDAAGMSKAWRVGGGRECPAEGRGKCGRSVLPDAGRIAVGRRPGIFDGNTSIILE